MKQKIKSLIKTKATSAFFSSLFFVALAGVMVINVSFMDTSAPGAQASTAANFTNNTSDSSNVNAGSTNVVVLDITLPAVGSDTTISGTGPIAGTAITATEDADWDGGAATTDFYFYDGGATTWASGDDWIGFDLDGDSVYTSAADTLVDADGTGTTGAGATSVTAGAALFDIVAGDLVVADSVITPTKVWRDLDNNAKYTGTHNAETTIGASEGDIGATVEALTNAKVSGADGSWATGEGVYVSADTALDSGDTILIADTFQACTAGKVTGADGVWAGDTSEGVYDDVGSVSGYVDSADTHITTETLTPLSGGTETTIYATSLQGIGIGDTLDITTTTVVSGAVSAVSGNTITIASTTYSGDPVDILATITINTGGSVSTPQDLSTQTVNATTAVLDAVTGIAIGDILRVADAGGTNYWQGTVSAINAGTFTITWTATQTGTFTAGSGNVITVQTPASPDGKVTTSIQALTNAKVTGVNGVADAGEGVYVSADTAYDTGDTVVRAATIQALANAKVTIIGTGNGTREAGENIYEEKGTVNNSIEQSDVRLTAITAEPCILAACSDNNAGINVAVTAGWVKENTTTWAVGDDLFIENYAGELTYSAAIDTLISGTAPAVGTATLDAKPATWTTIKFYDKTTGGAWDTANDWIGQDSDSSGIYNGDRVVSMKIHNGGSAVDSDITSIKIWEDGATAGWGGDETLIGADSTSAFWDQIIACDDTSNSTNASSVYLTGSSARRVFVTVDVASGASNSNLQAQLVYNATPANAPVQLVSSNDGPTDATISGLLRTIDVTTPTVTFSPTNGATGVLVNSTITLTFSEAMRLTDDTAIADPAALITLKKTNAAGANVSFTATINPGKTVITVTPSVNLNNGQLYYVAIGASVEDAADNAIVASNITFTTVHAGSALSSPVPTSTTGQAAATPTNGGVISKSNSDGTSAKVVLPAGALIANAVITISPITKAETVASMPLPGGKNIVGGYAYNFTAVSGLNTAVNNFEKALTLTFTYTNEQAEGMNEGVLKVHYWNDASGAWVVLADSEVDTAGNIITATTTHFTYFSVFEGEGEIIPSSEIVDGDIIQCQSSSNPFAVYIVKVVGDTKYIRHIVSLEIFNYYGHLKWENLKQIDSLDSYSLSGWARVNTGSNETAGPNDKVYEINGDQSKHWINMTAEDFLQHGGYEAAIYSVNQGELDLYATGSDVMML